MLLQTSRRRAILFAGVSALSVLSAGAATAEEVPAPAVAQVDDVVVTAAGFEQKIVDAPASISVITA